MERWDGNCNTNSINVNISDGTNLGDAFDHCYAYWLLIFNATSQWNVGLILRAIAGVNFNVLEVITAVWILQDGIVEEDGLKAIG